MKKAAPDGAAFVSDKSNCSLPKRGQGVGLFQRIPALGA